MAMAERGQVGERIKLAVESASSRLGYAALRKEQKEAITAFASGRDVLFQPAAGSHCALQSCLGSLINSNCTTCATKAEAS